MQKQGHAIMASSRGLRSVAFGRTFHVAYRLQEQSLLAMAATRSQ
jgi:hypothetical protein